MKTFKKLLFGGSLALFGLCMFSNNDVAFATGEGGVDNGSITAYSNILGYIISNDNSSLGSALKYGIEGKGGDAVNSVVYDLIGYMIDVFIVVGILLGFFGGYKIMVSNDSEKLKEGIRLVVYGIVGVIVMVSAKFISYNIIENLELNMAPLDDQGPNGVRIVSSLYNNVLYPFIKIALYLVIGVLFIMMAVKVITFIVSTEEKAKKQAGGIILWTIIGILIIMGGKQIVEAVMGKQEIVINENASKITGGADAGMGSQILQYESIPLVAQVINWAMGLTMFIVLILIIIQAYKMFTKPDDPKNRESLKKTLLYIIIGVLVIGASYVISNVLVINNLSN